MNMESFDEGYTQGYRDGREGKSKNSKYAWPLGLDSSEVNSAIVGYADGYSVGNYRYIHHGDDPIQTLID